MVVRDEQGNILNPMLTSAIQLYLYHDLATKRIMVIIYTDIFFKKLALLKIPEIEKNH